MPSQFIYSLGYTPVCRCLWWARAWMYIVGYVDEINSMNIQQSYLIYIICESVCVYFADYTNYKCVQTGNEYYLCATFVAYTISYIVYITHMYKFKWKRQLAAGMCVLVPHLILTISMLLCFFCASTRLLFNTSTNERKHSIWSRYIKFFLSSSSRRRTDGRTNE